MAHLHLPASPYPAGLALCGLVYLNNIIYHHSLWKIGLTVRILRLTVTHEDRWTRSQAYIGHRLNPLFQIKRLVYFRT